MFISTPAFNEDLAIVVVLVLIGLLILYELISDERKKPARGILLAAILTFLAAFVLIIIHRLEAII
jgi:uncharacterized membrane protein